MSASRGFRLPLLVALATLIGWLVLATPTAEAQVFKPRGKTAAGKTTPASAAAARKAAAPAATPSKKPTRALGTSRRVGSTPAKKSKRAGKARTGRDDDVRIEDEDDDVKITDD